jgi:hypothetical protein
LSRSFDSSNFLCPLFYVIAALVFVLKKGHNQFIIGKSVEHFAGGRARCVSRLYG